MITILLAWIEAKYKAGYETLFIGTFLLDIWLIVGLGSGLTNYIG